VAGLEAVGCAREDLLGGHTPTENTETTTRVAVVDEREFDTGFVGEFARDRRPGAPVGTDYHYVNHTGCPV
jgi:hypothetical protein